MTAERIVLYRLPIHPRIVLALIVDAATRRPGARNPGKAASGEGLPNSRQSCGRPGLARPRDWARRGGVEQWVVGADLGVAVDDRIGPIRVALRIRPGALRI